MAATSILKSGAARRGAARTIARRRQGVRTRTIPEQIADHLAVAIIKAEFRDGEHLAEQKIASLFDVSHGPVREAIRALSKRGLVEFRPRRGAFVIGVTMDAIADIFNIRAVLLGLAAHSLAKLPERTCARIADLLERVARMWGRWPRLRNVDAVHGSRRRWAGTAAPSSVSCGNAHLTRILREEAAGSLWGHLWREHTLDFLTPAPAAASPRPTAGPCWSM